MKKQDEIKRQLANEKNWRAMEATPSTTASPSEAAMKLQQLIKDLAGDFKPEVERIEAKKFATTQNHYGDYMALITMGRNAAERKIFAAALIMAGGNKQGVSDALRVSI